MTTISLSRLRSRVETLARFGGLPGGGVTRPAWSPPYEDARALAHVGDARGGPDGLGRRRRQHLRRSRRRDLSRARDPIVAHRLAHRHRSRGRHPRRRPRGDGRPGVSAHHRRARPRARATAGGRGVGRRGGALRQPLRLAGLLRTARGGQASRDGGRRRRAAGRRDGPRGLRRGAGPERPGAARRRGRLRRAAHRAGTPARGGGHSHRRGRVDRRRAPDSTDLHRSGRPCRHHPDGAPPRRISGRRGVRHQGP